MKGHLTIRVPFKQYEFIECVLSYDSDKSYTNALLEAKRLLETKCGLPGAIPVEDEKVKIGKNDEITFGKHKGDDLSALPYQYRKWLLGLPELDPDMRWSLNQL